MLKEVKVVKVMQVQPRSLVEKGPQVRRAITGWREGSDRLMLGYSITEPFGSELTWKYEKEDEVYYMISGEKTLWWEAPDGRTGVSIIRAGDAAYLPAGFRFRSINSGKEPYHLVYAITPPLE
ncbi:MAG: DUF861 domain-containing protein [Firmicutes bacterium]|nr:DUF861 domain-containing protein [Bacillota bacterium]